MLAHPGFQEQLGDLKSSRKGLITAIYYLGTFIGYVFLSHPAADRFGRRYAGLIGTLIICVGVALIAGATGASALGMVIAGRIIGGVGISLVSTSVPLFQRFILPSSFSSLSGGVGRRQAPRLTLSLGLLTHLSYSEVSPAHQRGRFVVMNHIGFVAGLASGFWYDSCFAAAPSSLRGVFSFNRLTVFLQGWICCNLLGDCVRYLRCLACLRRRRVGSRRPVRYRVTICK